MKLGTSLRFVFPTAPQTHEAFRRALAAAPAGSFIERPMGAYDTAEQARNWLEVAAAARAAGLDGLLVGDNHAVPSAYANCFAPVPSLARLMAVTGDMPVGMVLLAPFYEPIVPGQERGARTAIQDAACVHVLETIRQHDDGAIGCHLADGEAQRLPKGVPGKSCSRLLDAPGALRACRHCHAGSHPTMPFPRTPPCRQRRAPDVCKGMNHGSGVMKYGKQQKI